MNRPLHPTLPRAALRRFARLMQIHHVTHPERIALRYGVTAEYVRRQFRNLAAPDMDGVTRKLNYWLDYFDDRNTIAPEAVHSGRRASTRSG